MLNSNGLYLPDEHMILDAVFIKQNCIANMVLYESHKCTSSLLLFHLQASREQFEGIVEEGD